MSNGSAAAGLISRSPEEIARVLESVRERQALVCAYLPQGVFHSLLRHIDAAAGRIFVERCPQDTANEALLARPRCTFHAELPGWHVEFAAAAPRAVVHAGRAAIQLAFPDVLARHAPRQHPRAPIPANAPLRCVADVAGITSFDATVVDISAGGIGFIVYPSAISLEPGTLLRGCQIELPEGGTVTVDLEVRYSTPVAAPDGRRSVRSGCRLVDPAPEVLDLVKRYVKSP